MSIMKDSRVEEDIQHLKEWLQKQPHLPQDIDERMLAAYVYGTKSMERAKEKLENFFVCKCKTPYYFTFPGRDPDDTAFQLGCEAMKLFILPKLTTEGYSIVMCVFDMDLSKFNHQQFIARMTMMVDLVWMERPDSKGIMFTCDSSGLDTSILPKLSISASTFFLPWFEKAVPTRLKKLIFFNSPKFMDVVVNTFVKPFLSEKMCNRVLVTAEGVSITKDFFPAELLPCDYGGKEKSSADLNNNWLDKLQRKRDWFEKSIDQVADDSKRLPDGKNTYGVNGTFRSFNVD